MAAYVIAEIEVTDPVRYEEYKKLAGPALAAYGGRFLVRGGAHETLEGAWNPPRVIVIEFPDLARAKAWHASAEYGVAKAIRHRTAVTRMIVVEGVV